MEDYLSIAYWEFIMGVMMGKEGAATPSLLPTPKDHTQITHCSIPLQSSHIEEKNGKPKMLDSTAPSCDNQIQEGRANEISILYEECHLDSSHKVPNESEGSATQVKENKLPQKIHKRRKAKKSKVSSKKDNNGKFLCKECHRPFSTKYIARRHELSHKPWEELKGEKVYHEKCGECNKIFFKKQHFQRHIDMHKGVRRFKCHTCDKAFTQQGHLIRHSYVHLGDEEKGKVKARWKNNCYFCSKRFNTPSELIRHMVTHTRERPFKCITCAKTFPRNSNLTKHKRCHNKETRRAFKCETCEKSFTTKQHLSRHHSSVHLKEFHKCSECPKTYSQKGQLQTHMKKEHHN